MEESRNKDLRKDLYLYQKSASASTEPIKRDVQNREDCYLGISTIFIIKADSQASVPMMSISQTRKGGRRAVRGRSVKVSPAESYPLHGSVWLKIGSRVEGHEGGGHILTNDGYLLKGGKVLRSGYHRKNLQTARSNRT